MWHWRIVVGAETGVHAHFGLLWPRCLFWGIRMTHCQEEVAGFSVERVMMRHSDAVAGII